MDRDDGGPAFPRPYSTNGTAEDGPDPGMSLRDYFAGQALAGSLANGGGGLADAAQTMGISPSEACARACYEMADAMLSARGGTDG